MSSPGKLTDLSDPALNARSSGIPPPSNGMKRKTITERGGEPTRPPPPAPSSRFGNSQVHADSLLELHRKPSQVSSNTSRSTSATSSRAWSNGSLASSLGSMGRPHSVQSQRPRSAMGTSRIRKPGPYQQRPASSLEAHPEEFVGLESNGHDLGRTSLFLRPSSPTGTQGLNLSFPKKRQKAPPSCVSNESGSTIACASLRELSITAKMHDLSISDKLASSPNKFVTPSSTPSQIPRRKLLQACPPVPPSPSKSPQRPPKHEAPPLNKYTNTRSAWDYDSRLKHVEQNYAQFAQFGEHFNDVKNQNQILQDSIPIYKARSK